MASSTTTATSSSSGKRKRVSHTKYSGEELLNALPVEEALRLYNECAANAVRIDGCLFPTYLLKQGDYPRIYLNKKVVAKLDREDLKAALQADTTRPRVALHHLAWRALGNQLPDFEEGKDISHKCRKGQMQIPVSERGEKGNKTFPANERRFGCFNPSCLEVVTHRENLDRGSCVPIMECPNCKLFFNNCKHDTPCGTAPRLEKALKTQKVIRSIRIEFTDGTHTTLMGREPTEEESESEAEPESNPDSD